MRLLDIPNERSSHEVPTPRGGGISAAVGGVVALAWAPGVVGAPRSSLLVTAGGFAIIGLLEDGIGIPPLGRLLLQILMGVVALPWILSSAPGADAWQILFACGVVVWIAGYVNAFNFMDGINGLAVAQVVAASVAYFVIAQVEDVGALAAASPIVGAAGLAFGPFNFPRAQMFLGDVGSYFFGAWLAMMAVIGIQEGIPPEAVLAPLSLYLADTSFTLFRRVSRGESWHAAHREHTYQRLVQHGWSHVRTTLALGSFMIVLSALGALSLFDSLGLRVLADLAILALLALYLGTIIRFTRPTSRVSTQPDPIDPTTRD